MQLRPFAVCTLIAAALSVSCRDLPTQYGREVQVLQEGRQLSALNPNDIVVAPVEHSIPDLRVPDRELRTAFQGMLIRRLYSPLALDFVDSRVIEASYPAGTLKEQAVLQIVIHGWDDQYWGARDAMVVDIEARMLDSRNPDGPPLWAARLPRRFDMAEEASRATSDTMLRRMLCERIARDLLSVMPRRDVNASRP